MEPLAAVGQASLCSISLFITIIIIIPLFNIFVFHNHQYDQNQQGCILTKKEKRSKPAGMHTPDVNGEYTGGSGDHEYLFFEQFWSNGAGVSDLLRPGLKSINPGQIAVN